MFHDRLHAHILCVASKLIVASLQISTKISSTQKRNHVILFAFEWCPRPTPTGPTWIATDAYCVCSLTSPAGSIPYRKVRLSKRCPGKISDHTRACGLGLEDFAKGAPSPPPIMIYKQGSPPSRVAFFSKSYGLRNCHLSLPPSIPSSLGKVLRHNRSRSTIHIVLRGLGYYSTLPSGPYGAECRSKQQVRKDKHIVTKNE